MNLGISNLKRYGSVARLLIKYGRAEMPEPSAALPADQAEEADPDAAQQGEALAADLEALGPTFIKLGQLLSSRGTLIPPAYAQALERLQDAVEPFPYQEIERIVTDELGVRISKAFEHFDPTPLASASLGQVHRARLRDGREVVVKVQRPGVRQRISEDLDAFDEMAVAAEKHITLAEQVNLRAILEEFRRTIFEELDYQREADHLVRLAENLAGFERIVLPAPVPSYSTSRVLTMDYLAGAKITELNPASLLEVDGPGLVEELFQAYLQQFLIDGFFHADPHPGNVILTTDNRIGLLDLGMVGRLTPERQDQLLKLVLAIADGRGDETADIALAMAETRDDTDEAAYRRKVGTLVLEYGGEGLATLPLGQAFLDVVRVSAGAGVRMPPETAMIGKALYNLDGIARTLAPGFNPTESIRKNATKLLRQRMAKSLSPGNLFQGMLELRDFAERLPRRLNRVLDAAASNRLGIKVDTGINAPELMAGFQKVANRITVGLVLAALIVGAALLMQVQTTFRIFGYPGLAMLCFLVAGAAGAALVVSITTHDRRDARRHNRPRTG